MKKKRKKKNNKNKILKEKSIKIAFTGHRNCKADWMELKSIFDFYHRTYESITVIHGGAKGFDNQIHRTVVRLNSKDYKYGIKEIIIRPDYKNTDNPKFAPLKRNEKIVKDADVIYALWDERKKGGTWYTIQYANKLEKTLYFLEVK